MLLYDAIQSYEDTLTINPYTGYSTQCPSFWGEIVISLLLIDDRYQMGIYIPIDEDTYICYTWADGHFIRSIHYSGQYGGARVMLHTI
jgi:hypothetical protein